MKIHNYRRDGVYTCTTNAKPNPLEPGNFLIPARATTIDPGIPSSGHQMIWAGSGWVERPIPPNPAVVTLNRIDLLERQVATLTAQVAELMASG